MLTLGANSRRSEQSSAEPYTKKTPIMIQKFIEYCRKNKGLTEKTCKEYEKEIRYFEGWGSKKGLRWSKVEQHDIEDYCAMLHDQGKSANTIKKRITAIRQLYWWFCHQGLLQENPVEKVESPKYVRKLPVVASNEILYKYLDKPIRTDEERECHAFVALAMESGLRIGEILKMRYTDIDWQERSIHVAEGKGRKDRHVFFGDETAKYLALQAKHEAGILFKKGERDYRRMLHYELGHDVNGIHPHMLRHTFATNMVNAGMELQTIALLMGHAHAQTAEIYTHVAKRRMMEQYQDALRRNETLRKAAG